MKGIKHPKNDLTINPSGNPSIHDVIARVDPSRRLFIKGSVGAAPNPAHRILADDDIPSQLDDAAGQHAELISINSARDRDQ